MASYLELYELQTNSNLRNKITTAIRIASKDILDEVTPVTARVDWAKEALGNPESKLQEMMGYMLAVNAGAEKTAIESATDSSILANVYTAINNLIAPAV